MLWIARWREKESVWESEKERVFCIVVAESQWCERAAVAAAAATAATQHTFIRTQYHATLLFELLI